MTDDIRAKVAYLHGLAEGLDVETASNEGRMLSAIIGVLGDLADQVVDVGDAQAELAEYVEDVDYDLGALEDSILGEEEEADADDDEDEQILFVPDGDDDDVIFDADDGVEIVTCPQCGETLGAFSGTAPDMETVCPNCGCEVRVESVDA